MTCPPSRPSTRRLGYTYTVTMPMTVIKVTDGLVEEQGHAGAQQGPQGHQRGHEPVEARQPVQGRDREGRRRILNGRSIYKGRTFLYQLDSSISCRPTAPTRRWTSGTSRTRSTRRSTRIHGPVGRVREPRPRDWTARSSPPRARRSPAAVG